MSFSTILQVIFVLLHMVPATDASSEYNAFARRINIKNYPLLNLNHINCYLLMYGLKGKLVRGEAL
jgi:hypothetical protein